MKIKLRLLALLLALLMIPFGMLFACKDDEDTDEDPDKNQDDDDDDDNKGEQNTVVSVGNKKVDDGKKTGWLAFFSFDNADNGNLGVIDAPASSSDPNYSGYADAKPIEPYFDNFRGSIVAGGAYTVKTASGTDKYLSIQRTDRNIGVPVLDFNVGTAVGDLESDHIVQFQLDFTRGLFGATVSFMGVKGSTTQTLFSVKDDLISDCYGNVIYGDKDTDKHDWITVAMVISDAKKTYDIYIDDGSGFIKQTNGLVYSNGSYDSWNQTNTSAYRFTILSDTSADTFFRVDDVAIKNGKVQNLGEIEGEDVSETFTDITSSKVAFLETSVDGVKSFLATQTHLLGGLKKDIFGSGALLSDRITISKLNKVTGVATDIYHDYGALLGYYDEESVFEGANGDSYTVTTYNDKISYKADATTEAVEGTYSVADGVITIVIGTDTVYAKFANNVLTTYTEVACENEIAAYELAAATGNQYTLAENEVLSVKFTNFNKLYTTGTASDDGSYESGSTYFPWDGAWYAKNKGNLSGVKFGLYIPQAFYDYSEAGIEFSIIVRNKTYFDNAQNKNVGPYTIFTVKKGTESKVDGHVIYYVAGQNNWELDLSKMQSNYGGTVENGIVFKFAYWGWNNNLANIGDNPFYITEFEWVLNNIVVEVEGPSKECKHKDNLGDDAWVPVATPIEGNCHVADYYVKKCSLCGATEVDDSKPLGYIRAKHVYGDAITVAPTCTENGYTYKECTVCGDRDILETTNALGHEYIVASIVGKNVHQICKNCGIDNKFIIRNEMINYETKLSELGILASDKKTWSIDDSSNVNISGPSGGSINNFTGVVIKAANASTITSADTDYGKMLLVKGGAISTETYIDIVPGATSTTTFFKAQNFVFEFDYMKGEPGTNGQYVNMSAGLGWRNGPISYTKWGMLNFTTSGGLRLSEYGKAGRGDYGNTKEFETEKGVLYNVAVHHNLKTNTISLYINGVKWDECQFLARVEDSMTFGVTHIRFWCGGVPNGSEMYLDNYIHYAAETEPICVLTPDIVGGTDIVGEVELEDELLNTMEPDFAVRDNGHDVKFYVPAAISLKTYMLELTVNGSNLADGTLLAANKLASGYDRRAELVTVEEGKLYVLGVLVSETTENVKLAIAFDDNTHTINVYVNGEKISGTISMVGDFAKADGVIRSFELLNDCGSYTVSGLKLSTGSTAQ